MGDVELRVHDPNNHLSVVEIDNKRRNRMSTSSDISGGEYSETPDPHAKSKAEKIYQKKAPGIREKRHCRDIFCGFLFIQYWVVMFIIAYYAFTLGDPLRMIYGVDSQGNMCGVDNTNATTKVGLNLVNETYLFYFDPLNPLTGYSRCVNACPNYTLTSDLLNVNTTLNEAICKYGVPIPSNYDAYLDAIENGTCAALVVPCSPLAGVCVPNTSAISNSTNSTLLTELQNQVISALNARGISLQFQKDLYSCWKVIAICAGLSLVFSFLWIILLQLCAAFMVFITIILVVMTTAAAMLYLWYNYYNLAHGEVIVGPSIPFVTPNLTSYIYNKNTFLIGSCVVTGVSVLLYLALIFLRSRIVVAVRVIEIATKAVRHVPLLVFFPIIKFLMLCALTAWCVVIWIYLATAGTITQVDIEGYYTFQSNYILEYLQLYYLFGFLWSWNLIIAMADCTIAGVIGEWYWTMDKRQLPMFMIIPAMYRTFRYHLGSLAFGSFIIAVVQFIRYILYKLEKSLKKKESCLVKTLFKVMQCCLLCFERFLKFLNKNAYIEIAIFGFGFCKSARWAFQLIARNIIRVVVVSKIGDYLLLLGKIVVTVSVGIIGNILIEYYSDQPTYWVTPLLVILFMAYGTAYVFMAVLDMAINTIFICFCEDLERNDGSAERPYYMDPKLKGHIEKHSKDNPDIARK